MFKNWFVSKEHDGGLFGESLLVKKPLDMQGDKALSRIIQFIAR